MCGTHFVQIELPSFDKETPDRLSSFLYLSTPVIIIPYNEVEMLAFQCNSIN